MYFAIECRLCGEQVLTRLDTGKRLNERMWFHCLCKCGGGNIVEMSADEFMGLLTGVYHEKEEKKETTEESVQETSSQETAEERSQPPSRYAPEQGWDRSSLLGPKIP